ncbi:uncharacterized protein B0H18DRAFT_1113532 [Fomitopsis serialis]|uniref:uncharacterized protein n=1 Tax=Fomitopsis serialis TaxID=139415 RepID=UPI0020073B8E|nr:uncharacterized protein B0H18DRAFT_1113532 [Neoantrodia serialis]KAH9936080.1 hypothetical protein B0H18DRAFT_1113532 [Neoantrodia serialis]
MAGATAPDLAVNALNTVYFVIALNIVRSVTGHSIRTAVLAAIALVVTGLVTFSMDLLQASYMDYACCATAVFIAFSYLFDGQHIPQLRSVRFKGFIRLGSCVVWAYRLATVLRKLARLGVVIFVVVYNILIWVAAVVALRILVLIDPASPTPRHARIVRIVLCTSEEFARSLTSGSSTGRVRCAVQAGAPFTCPLQAVDVQRRRPLWRRALWTASCVLSILRILFPATLLGNLVRRGCRSLGRVSRYAIICALGAAFGLVRSVATKAHVMGKLGFTVLVNIKRARPNVPLRSAHAYNVSLRCAKAIWKALIVKFAMSLAFERSVVTSVLLRAEGEKPFHAYTPAGPRVITKTVKRSLPVVVPSVIPVYDLSSRWVKTLLMAFQVVGVPRTLSPTDHFMMIASQFNITGALAKEVAPSSPVPRPMVMAKRPVLMVKRGSSLIIATRVKRVLPVIVPPMVPVFEFNARWVKIVHATFGIVHATSVSLASLALYFRPATTG